MPDPSALSKTHPGSGGRETATDPLLPHVRHFERFIMNRKYVDFARLHVLHLAGFLRCEAARVLMWPDRDIPKLERDEQTRLRVPRRPLGTNGFT